MLATRYSKDSTMRDLEQELAATLARGFESNGQPREGFYNLARRMENEEEDQFDVDLTILDFLVHKATATVFEWQARENRWKSDLPNALITMTSDWRSFMSQKHQGCRLSKLAAFRSRLLQFVLLLTHRYHPAQTWTNAESLERLNQQNIARGDLWSKSYEATKKHRTLDSRDVSTARQRRMVDLNLPTTFTPGSIWDANRPRLDQLLPLFIELTAARANLGDEWQPTSDWFDLAGQFMLQAVIDQYLCKNQCEAATFDSVFAFGNPGTTRNDEGSDVRAMRSLFCKDDCPQEELPEWTAIRRRYIKEADTIWNLQMFEDRYSYVKFEGNLIAFLQHLHDTVIKPDLVQVEEGRINIDDNELSEVDSREMIERMRL